MVRVHLRVGLADGDVTGKDNRALQAAVDYVAQRGGGTVEILEGTYAMYDSLHLRSNVTVRGQGEETVLRKCDGVSVPLVLDGDYGEEQVTVADRSPFRVGMGVAVADDHAGGFHTTVGTITWQDGATFGVSTALQSDCMVHRNAWAATVFPVVSGYWVANARVERLRVEGNRENNPHRNGCRGAGIFLYRSHGTVIEGCVVRRHPFPQRVGAARCLPQRAYGRTATAEHAMPISRGE
jgi:hypothetical protein